jgi:hypothetical protein
MDRQIPLKRTQNQNQDEKKVLKKIILNELDRETEELINLGKYYGHIKTSRTPINRRFAILQQRRPL